MIYLGKVGALDPALGLYEELVTPDRFMAAEHDRVMEPPFAVANGLAAWLGRGGLHVTTPTILEQSHLQHDVLTELAPRSIDNEIAYMARAASAQASRNVRFSSLSFATDYVRGATEVEQGAPRFDLSNNRTPEVRARRSAAITRASCVLYEYLEGHPGGVRHPVTAERA